MLLENMSVGLAVGALVLLVASFVDIKIREVPDWISYSTIAFAVVYSSMLSIYHTNWGFLINSLFGLALGVIIGFFMFYTGQWGGGDSKLIMGLAALIGLYIPGLSNIYSQHEIFIFLLNTVLVGAAYGLTYSVYKGVRKFKECKDESKKTLNLAKMKYFRLGILIILLVGLIYHIMTNSVISLLLFSITILIAFLFYLGIFLSSVEKVCMIKEADVSKITEGDWLAKDVEKNGKVLIKISKIGLTKDELLLLKKNNVKRVTIKEGIPFVPSFLIAYILTFTLGNWILLLL